MSWIIDGTGGMADDAGAVSAHDPEAPSADVVLIEVSNVRFSGGPGAITPIYEIEEDHTPHVYQRSWFVKERMKPERCRRFRITGNSQEPFLFAGDWVLVNLDETTVENGKLYAFRYGDELRVKRLYKRINGSLLLISENTEEHPPEEVSPADVAEHITIIGRVRDKGGKGGL